MAGIPPPDLIDIGPGFNTLLSYGFAPGPNGNFTYPYHCRQQFRNFCFPRSVRAVLFRFEEMNFSFKNWIFRLTLNLIHCKIL
jgi:hypothetical protein